jgi:indolepyruvate ferredoxin oxidoreductase beta subunit
LNDNDKVWSVVLAGVGGQGVILAAEITALAAVRCGYDVKQTEVHGVSQRGGSVETQVRFGQRVWSPVVTPGHADAVVGMESLEALRSAHYTSLESGVVLINDYQIIPASVENAEELYPQNSAEILEGKGYRVIQIPATKLAHELGDGRMANVVMIGRLSPLLPFPKEIWLETLNTRIPEKYREPNLRAFEVGRGAADTDS